MCISAKMILWLEDTTSKEEYASQFRKNQNGFWRNHSTTLQILTIHWIIEGVQAKDLEETLLFVDFFKAFDSIHRENMEQILLGYGFPQNSKAIVCSPYRDTDFFNIVIGVLQGDTLPSYLFIVCLDYLLWTSPDLIKMVWFGLVSLFNDISTFVGYLMPKPSF